MKALLFEYSIPKLATGRIAGIFSSKGYLNKYGFLRYKEIPEPRLPADDWVMIRPRYCGICGSDHKQIFLDGNVDNPMTAVISWPQVLGHEVAGRIERVGSDVKKLKAGDRVVLDPWLSCTPRGFKEPCPACKGGKNTLCRNFTKGIIAPGIHSGNSADATGGFAELVPAHESMAVPIPEGVTEEQAVLADPFSVAFHSILKVNPEPGSTCGVYGCGNLGLLTIHILKKIFTGVRVVAIARFDHQAQLAAEFGADLVIDSSPARKVIETVAQYTDSDIYYPRPQKPWLIEGLDFLFDTVASRETLETGLRITAARKKDKDSGRDIAGTIVVTGVSTPKRYEWTPWYFKDLRVIGSNAFSIEEFEGRREHSYLHFFRFLAEGRIDISKMITHKFPLPDYKKAIVVSREQKKARAVKVLFEYPLKEEGQGR